MKRTLLLLMVCLLMTLPALGEDTAQESITLTVGEELTVTHLLNAPDTAAASDAELLIIHLCETGDYQQAAALNEQLAARGDAEALYRLGCHYLSGLGVRQDEQQALSLFASAKEAGSSDAALALILARLNGWGMTRDPLGATAELTALAQEGQFRYELALLYLHGAYDVPAHETTALYWFDLCYEPYRQSDPEAYAQRLADFRSSSPTCLTDRLPAQHGKWRDVGARAELSLEVARFWQEGRGGKVDVQAAARWYEAAAGLRHEPEASQAHEALSEMYLGGALGAVDAARAVSHLLQIRPESGEGAYRAAQLYWDGFTGGDGTVCLMQDRETALFYLRQSAEAGYSPACAFLGDVCRTGDAADARTAAHFYSLGLSGSGSEDCYMPLLEMYKQGLLYDRTVMEEIYAGLRQWQGTDHQLAILLAESWLNGVTAEDGTVLVAQDRALACELMEYFYNYHQSLHEVPEVFMLNWLGWFYSGNAPEAVERDYAKALAFYAESARLGNGYAMAMVGVFYQNGRGVLTNHMAARAWYTKALNAGYSAAQGYLDALNAAYPEYPADLAVTLTTSQGLTAAHIINRTDAANPTDAELLSAGYALDGQWELALDINRQLAEMGDVEAMFLLGAHYAGGLGIAQDDARAVEWLRKAADAGCEEAVFALACMYLNGWGVTQDAVRAAAMLEELSVSGATPDMQFLLATLYKNGWANLAPDEEKAQACLNAATAADRRILTEPEGIDSIALDTAARGYAQRMDAYAASTAPDARLTTRPEPIMSGWTDASGAVYVSLASLWAEGRCGITDYAAAIHWYGRALAANPGDRASCIALAEILRDGKAGFCDVQQAIGLFIQAGAFDEAGAMFDTGVTGPDGRVCLAPNTIIAGGFHTWAKEPGSVRAAILLGDLFRDGTIVTANANTAAAFYWGAGTDASCIERLTALIEANLVTDDRLLYTMLTQASELETDASALISALAQGVQRGTIAPDGVLCGADAMRLVREMLEAPASP